MSSICLAKQMGTEERVLAREAKKRGWEEGGVIGDEAKVEELGPDSDLLQTPRLNSKNVEKCYLWEWHAISAF